MTRLLNRFPRPTGRDLVAAAFLVAASADIATHSRDMKIDAMFLATFGGVAGYALYDQWKSSRAAAPDTDRREA